MEDSKEPNQQQQLQPPHGTLTGSYNRNAAALTGPTSTSQAMHQWLSVGDLSQRQPQQPWMQFGNEQLGRGRLRKYASDVIDLSLRLGGGGGASANSSDPPPVKRTRRRPPGPVKTQLNALGGAGTPFISDIIEVEAGEDIAAKIVAYTHQAGPREVVIISASGAVSSALLNSPSGVFKFEGQYEIVAMSGSFLNTESNGTVTITGDLSVSLANHNGKIVGGFVAGMLVAALLVQVGVGSFVPERVVENNPEPASASASATASGGGLNDSKSPLHQVGNSTPQPPDQMCGLRLWPGSNPHSIVFLVYEKSHGGDNPSPTAIMPTIPSPLPPQEHYVTPPLTVIFTVVFLIFIFVGFFTLYFCKCILDTIMHAWHIHHSGETEATDNPLQPPEAPLVNPGLDLRIINSFPTFPYFSVKDLREEKYGLECAICLLEFDEDHVLRLLTTCYHVFHQECIDLWFESHKTCPVCRHDLDPPPPPENTSNVLSNVDEMIINVIQETSYDDGDQHHHHQTTTPIDTGTSSGQSSCVNNEISRKEQTLPETFSRSHSTGHSIVRNKPEEEDKYTLRLPEHVKIKVTRGHSQTKSCVTFAELARRSYDHRRFGEVSNQTVATHSGE
ncbi:hypothetical protein IGI04_012813 [Brassica rapa subsp. trilocularis]|uniref:AT-hook motif nuclear-localized protein n=1 Tax=Brassica rapa subsp. trilocularis TaxID=1813537 RepID=A0ABQ7NA97_BRACM|nr:hypothetical protein IGI04_012813 [Brassica rapa subsp. trilocularis]